MLQQQQQQLQGRPVSTIQARRHRVADEAKFVFWAMAIGASVSLRLWCSVRLTSGISMEPLTVSCHVAARTMLLSGLCLLPFSSLRGLPRHSGPWLAGFCTLPAASFITSARLMGLGLSQMALKFSTLISALALDLGTGQLTVRLLRRRVFGVSTVLAGVALGIFCSGNGMSGLGASGVSIILVCVFGTLATGAGYVMQARLSAGARTSKPGALTTLAPCPPEEAEATSALVCQLVSATGQLALIALLSRAAGGASLGSAILNFPVRASDWHLWLFEGAQGAFYMRSMQLLPTKIGYGATFTFSLVGQLLTAFGLDIATGGIPSFARVSGVALVVSGAVVSASTPKETVQTKNKQRVVV